MTGVYISIPFCAQKCTYCNFASGVFPAGLLKQYLEALEAELSAEEWSEPPDTLYLGGGTPSLLEPKALARIFESGLLGRPPWAAAGPLAGFGASRTSPARASQGAGSGPAGRPHKASHSTPMANLCWREATIEAAPGTVTAERAAAWRELGINRVSLGVQSLVVREIGATGRKHSTALVEGEVELLRSAGISNINIDLIAGLPHQTRLSWRESLDWIDRLAPPHVSVYVLETDEDSRLGREVLHGGERYGASAVPDEDLVADLYLEAVERLARQGIRRYEISNFARPGFESAHNLKYWRLEPYRGFGADAHSFDRRRRWWNVETPAEYVERFRRGVSPVAHCEPVDHRRRMEEHFFLGLRQTAGIEPNEAELLHFAEPIRRLHHDGLLEGEDGRLRLADRAFLISNTVFEEFIGG